MKNLKDKIAVITGGNSGIGYATAKEFKEQGATVIITGRRKDALEKAAAGLGVTAIVADQSDVAETETLVRRVAEEFGQVDILLINAGIAGIAMIEQAGEAQFDEIMGINFKGAYFTLSKFIPVLKDGASVVFLSSNTASMNGVSSSVYSASKAALNSIMRIAALELAPRGIRVNAVSPGPIETDIMAKAGLDEATLNMIKTTMIDRIPLKKMGTTQDVAKMVAFFCGDSAGFITGAEVVMDGGMSL